MRACGACFFGWFADGAQEGECCNKPPTVFLVHDGQGAATFSSQRPIVGRSDKGCFFFIHKNEKPPTSPNTRRDAGE